MERKVILLGLSVIFFTSMAVSASVGAVPGYIDFGNVEKGEVIEYEVSVRSNDIEDSFEINPNVYSQSKGNLFSPDYEHRFDVSEQGFADWVQVEESTINPNNTQVITLPGGNSARVNGNFSFRINIPDSAEPGYRRGIVRLNPDLSNQGSGAGANFIGETRLEFQFRVRGDAEREVQVQDVRGFRLGESQAAVEVLLSNRGTVTTTAERFDINVFDSTRNEEATLTVNGATLAPGESQWVDTTWSSESALEQDTYQIDGEVDYLTGSSTASGSFSLPGFNVVEVRPDNSPAVDGDERESVPLWLVIMVLVIFGVLMWSFGIDPFWILLIIGILGISAFILMSGLSNLLLLVLLIVVGIVVYGGL